MSEVKYPNIYVQLSGEDGNAFGILAKVSRALRRAGVLEDEIAKYKEDAMSGDYDHLLQVTMQWVDVG